MEEADSMAEHQRNEGSSSPEHRKELAPALKRDDYSAISSPTQKRELNQQPYEELEEIQDDKKRHVCPFHFTKRPPKIRLCVYPGFRSISRFKEHLYRRHMQLENRCSRCLETFKTETEFRKHSLSLVLCPAEKFRSLNHIPGAHTSHPPKHPSKFYVPGFLGGHYVQANADTGASHDMISENYAIANNYHIDPSGAGPADLPGGRKAWILGTVTLSFRFKNDTKEYSRIFQVMRGLSYSCILGNGFLKLTKTLSVAKNRLDRIRQVAKRITPRIPRLHLIGGTHERLQGTLNGHQMCALPDTGADVNIIRSDVGRRLGLKIWSDRSHRKFLELGDGSFVRTLGTAYNAQWSFGPHGSTAPLSCEFQVLDDIPCDIILSSDFLFDNSVFELYEHYLYDASSIEQLETCAQLNCITEVPLPEQELNEMMMDVYCHGNEEDRIAGIPPMELPRVERVRFRLSRQRFSRIFTGNALPTGVGGHTPSPGGTALDSALSPPSTPPQQPKHRWIVRVVRLVTRRSDHEASLSASPSSVP